MGGPSLGSDTQLTPFLALIHLLKSNIGPGLLSLPHTFSVLPQTYCVPIFLLIFLLSSGNSLLIAFVADGIPGVLSYSALGEHAFGVRGRRAVLFAIVGQQMSICTVYFTFIATNLATVDYIWPASISSTTTRTRITMIVAYPVIITGVLLTNHISTLNLINSAAMVMLFASLIAILVITSTGIDVDDDPDLVDDLEVSTELDFVTAVTASCAILYSFEGICLVLPIRGALSPPSSFLLVYTIGITLVALIYYAFSYFVALDLNDNVTSGSITAYLTQDMDSLHSPAWLVHATNITLTLMVVITYPLMFFPVIEIINDESTRGQATATSKRESRAPALDSSRGAYESLAAPVDIIDSDGLDIDDIEGIDSDTEAPQSSSSSFSPTTQKIALVTVTFLIALLVSDTVAMISLAGSLTGSLSALLLPPIIAIKLLSEPGTWSDGEGFKRRIVLGGLYFSLLVGFVMTTAGVFASAKNIVEGSSSDP